MGSSRLRAPTRLLAVVGGVQTLEETVEVALRVALSLSLLDARGVAFGLARGEADALAILVTLVPTLRSTAVERGLRGAGLATMEHTRERRLLMTQRRDLADRVAMPLLADCGGDLLVDLGFRLACALSNEEHADAARREEQHGQDRCRDPEGPMPGWVRCLRRQLRERRCGAAVDRRGA